MTGGAVQKSKKSKAKTRMHRNAAWTLKAPPRSLCAHCGAAKVPHHVCMQCGWYKGREALDLR
jgi:large subunit ribosomal protein L32